MKAGIENSDKVTTVSPSYAQEILDPWYSHGLDPLLRERQHKLWGILNGIDYVSYNPAEDKGIVANFTADDFEKGKAACKAELREIFNLEENDKPIAAVVSRLVEHKGFDLVKNVAEKLVEDGYQLVVLGTGEAQYEDFFGYMAYKYPDQVGVRLAFIPALARKIYAGSDIFIMPSKSEPCGLSQMIALRYGTVPVVRETGGLRDSVHDCGYGNGNGFTFADYDSYKLYECCHRALDAYHDKENWSNLVKAAMESDCSWNVSAKEYIRMYEDCMAQW